MLRKQGGIAGASGGIVLMRQMPSGHGDGKAGVRQPAQAGDGGHPAVRPALALMRGLRVVIQADADGEPVSMRRFQRLQRRLMAPHRLHRIAEHQHIIAAIERIAEHRRKIGVHERLAAGKADFARVEIRIGFVHEARDFRCRQIDQRIIGRAAFHETGGAGQIA